MSLLPNETLLQFSERMSKVHKKDEFYIGRISRGNTRAIFDFEGYEVQLDTFNMGMFNDGIMKSFPAIAKAHLIVNNPPSFHWILATYPICGKKRAEKIAKHYKGKLIEEPYPADGDEDKWWYLECNDFPEVIHMIYDLLSGTFVETFGVEPEPYSNLFSQQEEQAKINA